MIYGYILIYVKSLYGSFFILENQYNVQLIYTLLDFFVQKSIDNSKQNVDYSKMSDQTIHPQNKQAIRYGKPSKSVTFLFSYHMMY